MTLSSSERMHALESWLRVRPYPGVAAALERLASAGRACLILSNGSPSMLQAAVSGAGLSGCF